MEDKSEDRETALRPPQPAPYRGYAQRSVLTPGSLTTRFLSTSSVVFSDGDTTLLGDGFVTRPGLVRVLLGRIGPGSATEWPLSDRIRAALVHRFRQVYDDT